MEIRKYFELNDNENHPIRRLELLTPWNTALKSVIWVDTCFLFLSRCSTAVNFSLSICFSYIHQIMTCAFFSLPEYCARGAMSTGLLKSIDKISMTWPDLKYNNYSIKNFKENKVWADFLFLNPKMFSSSLFLWVHFLHLFDRYV